MENCHYRPKQLMPTSQLQPGSATMYRSNYTAEDEMIESWLIRIQFGEYICNFIESGYDMGSIAKMTPEDLIAIGITNPNHRRILKTEIQNLACQLNGRCALPDLSVAENLYHWLYLIKLEEYHDVLCKQGYNTIDQVVNDLTWEDFEDVGIIKLGHQKRLILAIKKHKKDVGLFDSINSVSVIPPSLDSDYHLIEVKTNPNSSSSTTSSPAVTPSHHSSNLMAACHPYITSTAALIHPFHPHHGLNDLNVHQSFNPDNQVDDVGSQVMRIQCGGNNYNSSNSLMAIAPGLPSPSFNGGSTSCDSVTAAGGAVGSFINPGSAILPPAPSTSSSSNLTGGARPSSMISFLSTASHYSSSSSGISSTSSASSSSSTTSDNNHASTSTSSQSTSSPSNPTMQQQHHHQHLHVQPQYPPPPPLCAAPQFPHQSSQLVNVQTLQQQQQFQTLGHQPKDSASRPTGIVNPCSLPPVVPMIDDLDEIKRQLKQRQHEQQEMNYHQSLPHLQRSQSDASSKIQMNNNQSSPMHRNLIERQQVYQRPQELILSSPARKRNGNPPPPPPRRSSPTGSLSNESAGSSSIYQTPKVTVAPSSSLWALPTSSFLSHLHRKPSSATSSTSLSSVQTSQTLPTKGRIMKKSIIAAACPNPPVSSVLSSPAATIKKIVSANSVANGHSSLDRRTDRQNSHQQLNSQDDDLNDLIKALDSLSQSLGIEIKSSSLCN